MDDLPRLIPSLAGWYVVLIFSLTFHEFAHAWAAYRGGDPTAYEGGSMSLDPAPHLRREPVGMIIVPLLSFFFQGGQWMLGWASAPYDPRWAAREPRKHVLMSLAGPAANYLLALAGLIIIRVTVGSGTFVASGASFTSLVAAPEGAPKLLDAAAMALSLLVNLNVLLGTFNLLPLPPLDGAAVVEYLGPAPVRDFYARVKTNPLLQMLAMLVAWHIAPTLISPVYRLVVGFGMSGLW